ncbi:Mitogen-Activated Protein Kinase Kinase Kinase 8 [Marasmius tenuissimus]|uniref:Mitogen-Activated Protein Kinase Kinase Kinase 8 n=1 Tax=Marasmius tenuissimus TaxID=585030 RepID=A0ABR2ZI57_9AGAR
MPFETTGSPMDISSLSPDKESKESGLAAAREVRSDNEVLDEIEDFPLTGLPQHKRSEASSEGSEEGNISGSRELAAHTHSIHRPQCIPLPSQSVSGAPVTLHSILVSPEAATLEWDFIWSYQSVESMPLDDRWTVLREAATVPGLPSMNVVHPSLPWPITVHASGVEVTVVDVLVTISESLMMPTGAQGGAIRLDLLQGGTVFLGLGYSDIGEDVWQLFL